MSFEKEFAKESGNAIKAVEEVKRVVAIEVFTGIIISSPVGNPELWLYNHPERGYIDYLSYFDSAPDGYTGGRFRSNWFLSLNVASSETTDSVEKNKGGKGQVSVDIEREIKRFESIGGVDASFFLTNNLPYSERIEDGWSSQRPAGVVAPNVSRVNALIPKIEKAANAKYGVK